MGKILTPLFLKILKTQTPPFIKRGGFNYELIVYMKINIEAPYKLILQFLVDVARLIQSTQNNKFKKSLEYLKKEVKNDVNFLHIDKH